MVERKDMCIGYALEVHDKVDPVQGGVNSSTENQSDGSKKVKYASENVISRHGA